MLYNKFNLGLTQFTDKTGTSVLNGVLFKKDKTAATDRFVLVEMTTPNDIKPEEFPQVNGASAMRGFDPFVADRKGLHNINLPNKTNLPICRNFAIKHLDSNHIEFMINDMEAGQTVNVRRLSDDKFPDYESIFPKQPPMAEITVNGKILAEVLSYLSKMNGIGEVKMKIYGANTPIVITAESGEKNRSARAMVMPMKT